MKAAAPLVEAAREAQSVLAGTGCPAIIIGGLAVLRWGEPRLTRDVDFTLLWLEGRDHELAEILARLPGRIENALGFASRNRVLLVRASNGVPVDVALGSLPYESRAMERGSEFEYEHGILLRTCSAEDLVVMKTFSGREHDFVDVEGILARQGGRLDWEVIERELPPLLEVKGEKGNWTRLVAMRRSMRG